MVHSKDVIAEVRGSHTAQLRALVLPTMSGALTGDERDATMSVTSMRAEARRCRSCGYLLADRSTAEWCPICHVKNPQAYATGLKVFKARLQARGLAKVKKLLFQNS
jgi:rubrerythrin